MEAGAPKAPVVVPPKGVLDVVLPKGLDVVVAPEPKPVLFPNNPPEVLEEPKPDVVEAGAFAPNPPKPVEPDVAVPLPNKPPPAVVVVLPKPPGFAPNALFCVDPKPDLGEDVSFYFSMLRHEILSDDDCNASRARCFLGIDITSRSQKSMATQRAKRRRALYAGASMEQRWDEKSLPHRRHTSRTAEATRSAAKEAATSIVRGAPKSGRGRGAEAYPEGRCG